MSLSLYLRWTLAGCIRPEYPRILSLDAAARHKEELWQGSDNGGFLCGFNDTHFPGSGNCGASYGWNYPDGSSAPVYEMGMKCADQLQMSSNYDYAVCHCIE